MRPGDRMSGYGFKADSGGAGGAGSLRRATYTDSRTVPTTSPFRRSQGADVSGHGVRYRIWSDATDVALCIVHGKEKVIRSISLEPEDDGYWSVVDPAGRPGDLYRYAVNGTGP